MILQNAVARTAAIAATLVAPMTLVACGTNGQIAIPNSGRGHDWISGEEPDPQRINVAALGLWGLSKPTAAVVGNYDAVSMVGAKCVLAIDQLNVSPTLYEVAIVPNDEAASEPHQREPGLNAQQVADFLHEYATICE